MVKKLSYIKKIAVLRANALGDFVFALPALIALKQTYPEAEIVLLGKTWHKKFLENRPGPVDRVVVIPPTKGINEAETFEEDGEELRAFFQTMRAEHFDIAVQIHGGGRYSNPFLLRLGANLTIGTKTLDAVAPDLWIPYIYYQSEIMRYLEVVSLIGATTPDISPHLPLIPSDFTEAKDSFPSLSTPYLALHPGATDLRRRWNPKNFAAAGDYFAQKGLQIVVTGVNQEEAIVREVIENMTSDAVNLCGKTTIGSMGAILSQAEAVIVNDTGTLHLADAVGARTVGLFWGGNLINGGPPFRTRHRPALSWMISCPLCGQNIAHTYPFLRSEQTCQHDVSFVDAISVAEVINLTEDLLLQHTPEAEDLQKRDETVVHIV
jgi:ADP-heptose:LPS heptosyltransferase